MAAPASRIEAERLGVRFYFDGHSRVTTPIRARLSGRRSQRSWGVHEVSFALEGGEGIALIGPSGSGKTTLLRTLGGVYGCDAGSLRIEGRVGSLLSIDAGLTPTLTGRENAVLLAVLAGLSRVEAKASLSAIERGAALGGSFDRPASSYSQGMRARLALAAAEQATPSILLLDEVHEALDLEFRLRLAAHARQITAAGGIVVAAGHDHEMLATLCGRCIWLEGGRIHRDGSFAETTAAYRDTHGHAAGD